MKVSISKSILNENVDYINDFLSRKGMSKIIGGKDDKKVEVEWGNTNYAESTRIRH